MKMREKNPPKLKTKDKIRTLRAANLVPSELQIKSESRTAGVCRDRKRSLRILDEEEKNPATFSRFFSWLRLIGFHKELKLENLLLSR